MMIGMIHGYTRIIGESQGYKGLPLRDGQKFDHSHYECSTPTMTSAWFPDAAELARLVAGAPIYLEIMGTRHPPVLLSVGEPFIDKVPHSDPSKPLPPQEAPA